MLSEELGINYNAKSLRDKKRYLKKNSLKGNSSVEKNIKQSSSEWFPVVLLVKTSKC